MRPSWCIIWVATSPMRSSGWIIAACSTRPMKNCLPPGFAGPPRCMSTATPSGRGRSRRGGGGGGGGGGGVGGGTKGVGGGRGGQCVRRRLDAKGAGGGRDRGRGA